MVVKIKLYIEFVIYVIQYDRLLLCRCKAEKPLFGNYSEILGVNFPILVKRINRIKVLTFL